MEDAAIVDLYDTIGHAHRVYKPCQGSAFRIVIEDKMREAEAAFAAIAKPPKRLPKETVELTEQDAALLADFGKALAGARSGDVHAVQTCISNAIGLAIAQIVHNHHVLPGFVQGMHHMGANVATAACYKNGHVGPFHQSNREYVLFCCFM